MPLILAIMAASSTGALVFSKFTDDVDKTVTKTGPDLIVLGLAGVALYGMFIAIDKGKVF